MLAVKSMNYRRAQEDRMEYKDLPKQIKKMTKVIKTPEGRERYVLFFCGYVFDIFDSVDKLIISIKELEFKLPKSKIGGTNDSPRAYQRT
jgi:hypothetical protein